MGSRRCGLRLAAAFCNQYRTVLSNVTFPQLYILAHYAMLYLSSRANRLHRHHPVGLAHYQAQLSHLDEPLSKHTTIPKIEPNIP